MIHAVEVTDHTESGVAAPDFLRDYAPGLSHLSHMPSHIDIRRGHWEEAVLASERAIAADAAYSQIVRDPGHYRILMIHNNHMLAYAAAMQGESGKATQAVQEMLAGIPEDFIASDVGRVDYLFALPYQLHVRFGLWKALLAEPPPRSDLPVANAMFHWARATAYAASGELEEAKYEQVLFLAVVRSLPPGTLFRRNEGGSTFRIAAAALAGQILYQQGKREEGIAQLREAVQLEDALAYVEPPEWVQPVRHVLGAVLLDAGRDAQAETVYREDLVRHPENGWSLYGLSKTLRKQKKTAAAEAVEARFKKAWQHADIKLSASSFSRHPFKTADDRR
jgi:tetratricopeptide (TPR) repeat protein